MAEAVGLVTNVIPLGITVCNGLITYYKGWKSRDEDVFSALQSLQHLTKTFELLGSLVPKLQNSQPAQGIHLKDGIDQISTKIKNLEAILQNCKKESPKYLKEKFADLSKRAIYPFNKKTIRELQDTVQNIRENIAVLLEAVGLNINLDLEQKITSIEGASSSIQVDISHIKPTISTINQNVMEVQTTMVTRSDIASISHIDFKQEFQNLQDVVSRIVPETSSALEQMHNRIVENTKDEFKSATKDLQLAVATKPAVLRNLNDGVEKISRSEDSANPLPSQYEDSSSTFLTRRCICQKRNMKSTKKVKRGPFQFFQETTISSAHHESCPYYTNFQWSSQVGIETKVLSHLLSRVVDASFTATFGAGGFSISPSLKLRSILRPDSPGFSLFNPILAPWQFPRRSPEALKSDLRRLFRSGEISPYEVDSEGRTLLHSLLYYCRSFSTIWEYRELVVELIDSGTPLNEVDKYGCTLLDHFIQTNSGSIENSYRTMILCKLIINAGAEFSMEYFSLSRRFNSRALYEVEYCRQSDHWIVESECGELSRAVLSRSERKVRQILRNNPVSIMEQNRLGYTTLHLACGWPIGLKILLEAGGAHLVNTPHWIGSENRGNIPLINACAIKCLDSMNLLLDAGSALSSPGWDHPIEQVLQLAGAFQFTSSLIPQMKNRRNQLRDFAHQTIPKQTQTLDINDDLVLDAKLWQVQQALEEHGITIPVMLKGLSGPVYCSIWGLIRYGNVIGTANRFFDSGFHDIDEPNCYGRTPLSNPTSMYVEYLIKNRQFSDTLEYAAWLLSKGANLYKPQETTSIAAHYLSYYIGRSMIRELMESGFPCLPKKWASLEAQLDGLNPPAARLMQTLLLIDNQDGCHCHCSVSGCTPLVILLKAVWHYNPWLTQSEEWWDKLQQAVSALLKWLERQPSLDWTKATLLAFAIQNHRFFLFKWSGLSHTCCSMVRGGFEYRSAEEVRTKHHQEKALIIMHQKLLQKFTEEFRRSDILLSEFWDGHWKEIVKYKSLSDYYSKYYLGHDLEHDSGNDVDNDSDHDLDEEFFDNVRQLGVDI